MLLFSFINLPFLNCRNLLKYPPDLATNPRDESIMGEENVRLIQTKILEHHFINFFPDKAIKRKS